jgi:hypothetical protein
MPVLTIFAPQIATCTGKTQPEMAGDEMIKRCFFYRADIDNGGLSINNSI